jgi:3',5'-cyclic AMP phosphodiesterase CpdA
MVASIAALAGAGAAVAAAAPANASPSRTASVSGSASTDPGPVLSSFNVISDIQGDLGDFGRALDDMSSTNPRSTGLVVNGDITPRGYDFEYAAVRKTLDEHPHAGQVHWGIGNHEFYVPKYKDPNTLNQAAWPNGTTEASLFNSFYKFTGRDQVYTEISLGGVPGLILGTEKYMKYHDASKWDEVWLSDAQLAWLRERLAFWAARGKPVMVFSHHPLPDTVSGTRNKLYSADYLQADRLLGILGPYPNVFLFSSHTHWALTLADWEVRRTVPGSGNLLGFQVFNTGAIETLYTDNGTGGERALDRLENTGLQVSVYPDQVRISARDFRRKQWLKEAWIPLV